MTKSSGLNGQQVCAGGASLRTIASSLTADGVPTARVGAKWHASTVKAVLEGQDGRTLMQAVGGAYPKLVAAQLITGRESTSD
jgi:hypothetical protein